MGWRVIDIQPTPNPNALKFLLDQRISDQSISFFNKDAAADHPLAAQLFEIPGVSSLLLLGDFITVNKTPRASWSPIQKRVKAVLTSASKADEAGPSASPQ